MKKHGILKTTLVTASAAATVLTLAACGSSGGGSGSGEGKGSSGQYVIGQIGDLTGGFVQADVPFNTGITSAVKAINAAGGVNGHTIKLITLDTAGSTSRAATDLQTLQSAGALIATNMSDSTIFQSILPAAARAKITLMGIQPSESEVSQANGYAFEFGISASGSIKAMVDAVAAADKSAHVGVVVTADPDGQEITKAVETEAQKQGITFAGSVAPASPSDYGSAAARIVADKATVVLTELVGTAETDFMRDLRSAGFADTNQIIGFAWSAVKPPMPWANFATLEQYQEIGSSPAVKAYRDAVTANGANPDDVMIVDGYAQMMIVKDVLTRCGWPCSLDKFHDTLQHTNTDLDGLAFGPVVYTADNHRGPTAGALKLYDSSGNPTKYSPAVQGL
jgi:branched-chain amino acid transport system substrate-binding protein